MRPKRPSGTSVQLRVMVIQAMPTGPVGSRAFLIFAPLLAVP